MDVGDGNPVMDRKLEENIEFGVRIFIQSEYWEEQLGSGSCDGNPVMDRKPQENMEFGLGFSSPS